MLPAFLRLHHPTQPWLDHVDPQRIRQILASQPRRLSFARYDPVLIASHSTAPVPRQPQAKAD